MQENVYEKIRREFKENDDIRDDGLTTPEDVERVDDICYGTDTTWQVLDVYRPKAAQERKLPVIISYHGGGWVYGDKERYQYYGMSLAKQGFAVVNFTYRLAPEFQYPAPLEDMNLVVKWVLSRKEQYGFDTDNVFLVGDSAGGHGIVLYTAMCTNPKCAGQYAFSVPHGFIPNAIAINCGVAEVRMTDEQTKELMKIYLPGHGTKEELDKMSPLLYITEQFPPTFVMTAEGDFLRDDAMKYAKRLTECNVENVYRYYKSADGPLGHVFHCNMKSAIAHACNEEECAFFRNHMV